MSSTVAAVIFKLVSDPLQHGGLAIARSLGRLGAPIYTVYRDKKAPAAQSRYVTESFFIKGTVGGAAGLLGHLLDVSARVGDRPILIPIDDVAATFVDRHGPELAPAFRFPLQPAGLPSRLTDKGQLDQLCRTTGTPVPGTRFPRSKSQFSAMAAELGFPVVLKSMDPVVLRSRPRALSVALAPDASQALELYRAMEVPDAPNLMLQEYIPGGASSVWMFNGYFDSGSACRFGITGRKIRQAPPDTGATSLGVCLDNDAVRSHAARLLQEIGYRGIVDMGFRFDARDGSYRLLDVNPRIGSSFRLFVDQGGMDVVRALYLDMTGQPISTSPLHEGRRWLVENQDLATSWKLLRRGRLSLAEWVRSLRGVEELAWMAKDDLRPASLMILGTVRDAVIAVMRRFFGRDR